MHTLPDIPGQWTGTTKGSPRTIFEDLARIVLPNLFQIIQEKERIGFP